MTAVTGDADDQHMPDEVVGVKDGAAIVAADVMANCDAADTSVPFVKCAWARAA